MDSQSYNIVELTMSCSACPSAWEAYTDDGRKLYIRYRWGHLSVEEDNEYVFGVSYGHPLEGTMTTREMLSLMPDFITFDVEIEDDDEDVDVDFVSMMDELFDALDVFEEE